MVGVFYRAPAPGEPPFVELGQTVKADQILCILEVMKLMNSIASPVEGTVTHILVENAEPVEFGQVIMVIDGAS
jgi:acetyl-CoA carboxylase biotin carboxyl carrier protein